MQCYRRITTLLTNEYAFDLDHANSLQNENVRSHSTLVVSHFGSVLVSKASTKNCLLLLVKLVRIRDSCQNTLVIID